jgi:hypothetical protein
VPPAPDSAEPTDEPSADSLTYRRRSFMNERAWSNEPISG